MAGQRWTDEELEYVRANYGTLTRAQIAKKINRSTHAISRMACTLGLTKEIHRWTPEEIALLSKMYPDTDNAVLAEVFNTTWDCISVKSSSLGLTKTPQVWTDDKQSVLEAEYPTVDQKLLARKLGVTETALQARASKTGIYRAVDCCDARSRTYSINHHFFSEWSREMATVAGFIAADGCVSKSIYRISIGIKGTDYNYLCKLNKLMDSEYPVVIRDDKCFLDINSKMMHGDLIKLGITPRKSLTLEWPDVPDEFVADFVRGYFDGDGGFYWDGRWLKSSITSTFNFLCGIKDAALRVGGVGLNSPKVSRQRVSSKRQTPKSHATFMDNGIMYSSNGVTSVLSMGNDDAVEFGKWIYSNGGVCMQRKKSLWDSANINSQ